MEDPRSTGTLTNNARKHPRKVRREKEDPRSTGTLANNARKTLTPPPGDVGKQR
jgi:hypothetical protein